jgi:hypothetical protein
LQESTMLRILGVEGEAAVIYCGLSTTSRLVGISSAFQTGKQHGNLWPFCGLHRLCIDE